MDTSTESVGSSDPATPKTVISPPDIDELRDQLSRIRNSAECFDFCNTIDAYSQDVDGFHFANLGLRNQFGVLIYSPARASKKPICCFEAQRNEVRDGGAQ
ncbi:hypothetical protein TNCV_806941 [Trichonephila clavipes]|nr:hypothetical protein TNCV_806941 [Trichonephila clavipes]